jgi:hypothetical protein
LPSILSKLVLLVVVAVKNRGSCRYYQCRWEWPWLQESFLRIVLSCRFSAAATVCLGSPLGDLRPREGKLVNGHLVEGPQEVLVVVPDVAADGCAILSPAVSEEKQLTDKKSLDRVRFRPPGERDRR